MRRDSRAWAALDPEDLLTWDGPDPDSYDLVSCQFMHMPPELRTPLFARLAASVVAGSLDRARWDVLVAEAASRSATGPAGDTILVHDAVLRAQRRPALR